MFPVKNSDCRCIVEIWKWSHRPVMLVFLPVENNPMHCGSSDFGQKSTKLYGTSMLHTPFVDEQERDDSIFSDSWLQSKVSIQKWQYFVASDGTFVWMCWQFDGSDGIFVGVTVLSNSWRYFCVMAVSIPKYCRNQNSGRENMISRKITCSM